MANKWTALNAFWNNFGIPAYDENTVPDGAVFPYITYQSSVAGFEDRVLLTASVWYQSTSWKDISDKVEEIETYIGGGAGVRYDSGRLWITKGSPFAQRMEEPSSDLIRRIVIQVIAEYQ